MENLGDRWNVWWLVEEGHDRSHTAPKSLRKWEIVAACGSSPGGAHFSPEFMSEVFQYGLVGFMCEGTGRHHEGSVLARP
jgi:hypothetical protein